jgi:hypothetical protein
MRVPGLMALLNSMVAHALEAAGNDRSRAHSSERYADLRGKIVTLLEEGRAAGSVRSDISLAFLADQIIGRFGLSQFTSNAEHGRAPPYWRHTENIPGVATFACNSSPTHGRVRGWGEVRGEYHLSGDSERTRE